MFRNLFTAFATLMLGAGAASAATTTDQSNLSLDQRVQAAQRTIGQMIDATVQAPAGEKVTQYWHNGYYRPWHNWNNWSNWRNYRRYGY